MSPPRTDTVPGNRFRDPAARNYLFISLAALLVVAAVMFLRGGLPGALLPAVVAILGLLARWTAMPGFFLLLLCYLLVLPFGVPLGRATFSDIPRSHFRVEDLILVGAVLTYFLSQYRLLSLIDQGMPLDVPPSQRRKEDRPPQRPAAIVPTDEIGRMFTLIGVSVVVGQIVWVWLTEFRIDFRSFPPIRLAGPGDVFGQRSGFQEMSASTTRFLLLIGLLALFLFPVGLVFWYWRWNRLTPTEARLVLVDTTWAESRRELSRQEKWRAWAAARARLRRAAPGVRLGLLARILFVGLMILGVILVFWLSILWFVVLREE